MVGETKRYVVAGRDSQFAIFVGPPVLPGLKIDLIQKQFLTIIKLSLGKSLVDSLTKEAMATPFISNFVYPAPFTSV